VRPGGAAVERPRAPDLLEQRAYFERATCGRPPAHSACSARPGSGTGRAPARPPGSRDAQPVARPSQKLPPTNSPLVLVVVEDRREGRIRRGGRLAVAEAGRDGAAVDAAVHVVAGDRTRPARVGPWQSAHDIDLAGCEMLSKNSALPSCSGAPGIRRGLPGRQVAVPIEDITAEVLRGAYAVSHRPTPAVWLPRLPLMQQADSEARPLGPQHPSADQDDSTAGMRRDIMSHLPSVT
jgi:hypothetical protein